MHAEASYDLLIYFTLMANAIFLSDYAMFIFHRLLQLSKISVAYIRLLNCIIHRALWLLFLLGYNPQHS